MIIPVGFVHVQHFFSGNSVPNGAAVTYATSGFGAGTLQAFAQEMHELFATSFMPDLNSGVTLSETRAKAGPNTTGPFATYASPVTGGASSAGATPQVAYLIEKRTALGGREGRGRFYLPGVVEGNVQPDGQLDLGVIGVLQGDADDFLTGIEATTAGMFLLHNSSSNPTMVTSLEVDPVVATQRRRLR